MRNISKWLFCDIEHDLKNLRFRKTLPFITFSDIKVDYYPLITELCDKIHFDRNLLVSVGTKKAPFGITLSIEDTETLNSLLNSALFSLVFTDDISETKYLIQSVLAGIIPICNINHPFIYRLDLDRFACPIKLQNLLDNINDIRYKSHIHSYRINWLSSKYHRQLAKWID